MQETKNIHFLSDATRFAEQERIYLSLRQEEGWLMDDDAVRRLPMLDGDRHRRRIGIWRKRSVERLLARLRKKQQTGLRIADIGCGNGWMSALLSRRLEAEVWGIDVNRTELEQAARVFGAGERLKWLYADIFEDKLPESYFDALVFAGSFQYFNDAAQTVAHAKRLLKPGGEIHIIDTPFYADQQRADRARAASEQYYAAKQAAPMIAYYRHHMKETLRLCGAVDLNAGWAARCLQKARYWSPFPWAFIPA